MINPFQIRRRAKEFAKASASIRHGQSLMNAAAELCPEFERAITGTRADCFYLNSNTGAFWDAFHMWNIGGITWESYLTTIATS